MQVRVFRHPYSYYNHSHNSSLYGFFLCLDFFSQYPFFERIVLSRHFCSSLDPLLDPHKSHFPPCHEPLTPACTLPKNYLTGLSLSPLASSPVCLYGRDPPRSAGAAAERQRRIAFLKRIGERERAKRRQKLAKLKYVNCNCWKSVNGFVFVLRVGSERLLSSLL